MYSKYVILKEIFEVEGIELALKNCHLFNTEILLNIISKTKYSLRDEMPCSVSATTRWLKKLFPDRPATTNKLDVYLLHKYGYKECKNCCKVFTLTEEFFHKNSGTKDKYSAYCKQCMNKLTASTSASRQAKYKASKIQRTPKWVSELEQKEIALFYSNCPTGYHVDHIIPLQGTLVSGLHVLNNLQYLSISENCSKSNKFTPS